MARLRFVALSSVAETTMDAPETIEVCEDRVACDGGGGALGHPRVYLTLEVDRQIDCPYCGRRYVRKRH